MSDYLLLAGVALCLISVVVAIVQLVQTRPPRAAVITLIIGIVALFAGAYLNPEPFQANDIVSAWDHVVEEAQGSAP
ncbi:hypothetical protein MU516_08285 [Paracoccus sp. YLB-12]|uniref:Uncharacterized protein n=1 Tax=Paracoccus maritimus TaxID=2933292 RepID=A0ABT2K8K5_9RHOB|nr:hypothetical protein [Paracoccus sp. YLB-12]MCT4332865.1 hypothetical protein [Paracoccus sp. YLB-12]